VEGGEKMSLIDVHGKKSAVLEPDGTWRNCDGTTIKDRKPYLNLCSNHYRYVKRIHRIWNPKLQGQAFSDGGDWYK
jgi:hypothetical protein